MDFPDLKMFSLVTCHAVTTCPEAILDPPRASLLLVLDLVNTHGLAFFFPPRPIATLHAAFVDSGFSALQAFKLVVADPDAVLGSLTKEITETLPDGTEVHVSSEPRFCPLGRATCPKWAEWAGHSA